MFHQCDDDGDDDDNDDGGDDGGDDDGGDDDEWRDCSEYVDPTVLTQ